MFRTKSRKEKNKLASRACRLKKKAQHEANKIKLSGLEDEHSKCNIADAFKAINKELRRFCNTKKKNHKENCNMFYNQR